MIEITNKYLTGYKYIDLFGFNPKWGISGQKLPGIRYVAQPYNSFRRLYE